MDYSLRGKCKVLSELAVSADSSLKLVKGWYDCPFWGRQEHWWAIRANGEVVDPTKDQFPSGGEGEYVPFSGFYYCKQCGEEVLEENVVPYGHHVFCSDTCIRNCFL
jgi:hypothetical protein